MRWDKGEFAELRLTDIKVDNFGDLLVETVLHNFDIPGEIVRKFKRQDMFKRHVRIDKKVSLIDNNKRARSD